jgi:1,4-alpha-glucan branching enzyme
MEQTVISQADIDALIHGQHANPFSVLGLHADASGKLYLRAFLPGANVVNVLDADGKKIIATLALKHPDGLFEAAIPRRRKHFDYRLQIQWANGEQGVYADAYAFGPQLSDHDLYALRDGVHLQPYTILGAHLLQQDQIAGARFAVWAPNARRVSVVGSFNQWDGRRHAMRLRHDAGVWEIFIPHVASDDLYKFEILDGSGTLLPLKADPYAFAAQLRPETASRVSALPAIQNLNAARSAANMRSAPISIYEVHFSSWRHFEGKKFPSWDDLANTLPSYAADLGFTHIELMPITEYPFDGSWGYQTLGLYAVTARMGSAASFAEFVRACHAKNIGVLLDWVPAHFPEDAHGLKQFDGTALYEYADPREGYHNDWNTLIYNFGRNEVRNYLAGNALFWLQRYGVDGLRVDAVASMLYRDYSRPADAWVPNAYGGRENLEAISLFKRINEEVGLHAAGAMTAAEESTSFPGVSAPTHSGGLGFHYKWNMGWMNDTLQYMHEEPVHRRWHHNKMSFGMVYAYSENFILPISHDEVVHGKGSMLNKMPGDVWQKFANLRAYYGFMWGHPGKKLLFMGQEFAAPDEWHHDAQLPWHLLHEEKHAGMQSLLRDLNHLYRKHSALHALDCEAHGFEWLVSDDADNSVFAWLRRDGQGNEMIVICNFTPVPREHYRVGLPSSCTKTWREILNTDSQHYGGSNLGNGANVLTTQAIAANGREQSLRLDLPPLATLFLVPN